MKLSTLSLTALTALTLFASCASVTAAPRHALRHAPTSPTWQVGLPPIIPPLHLLILGDSITAGYGASQPAVTGYAPLLAADLHVSSTAGIYGYPGFDSAQVLAMVPPAVLAATHNYVVIETGTNDWDDSTPAQFQTAYSALVNAATATLAGSAQRAQLVCLTAWHDPAQVNALGLTVAPYNAVITSDCHAPAASSASAHVVDITSLYGNPAYHNQGSGDTFHPNDAGHAAIAAVVMAAIS